jgi:hypothetical protein
MGHPQVEYSTSQSLQAIMPTLDRLYIRFVFWRTPRGVWGPHVAMSLLRVAQAQNLNSRVVLEPTIPEFKRKKKFDALGCAAILIGSQTSSP